ncbi:MAG: hypothetical protein RIC38_05045 [Chromatocurvus sp.]
MSRRFDIRRRDCLGGVALGTAASAVSPIEALAASAAPGGYPPALMGMRDSQSLDTPNSDAAAYAFVNGAIDAAWRATLEQLG